MIHPRFEDDLGAQSVRPERTPRGANFMTPEIIGYVDVDGETVEISTGTGFAPGSRIYGVTWLTFDGDDWAADERSTCCHSWAEVLDLVQR